MSTYTSCDGLPKYSCPKCNGEGVLETLWQGVDSHSSSKSIMDFPNFHVEIIVKIKKIEYGTLYTIYRLCDICKGTTFVSEDEFIYYA